MLLPLRKPIFSCQNVIYIFTHPCCGILNVPVPSIRDCMHYTVICTFKHQIIPFRLLQCIRHQHGSLGLLSVISAEFWLINGCCLVCSREPPIKHLLLCISHDAEVPVAKYYRRPCRFGPVKGSMVRNLRLRAAKLSLLNQQGSRAPSRKEPLEKRWCEGWTCETDRKNWDRLYVFSITF